MLQLHESSPGEGRIAGMRFDRTMRQAMRRRELVLHYQPAVDLRRGGVCGVEALVRWRHPQRGLIDPDEFVPRLERSRLWDSFDEYVLEEAIEQAAAWRKQGFELPVSVNVAPRSLGGGLVESVRRLLHRHALPPRLLRLEITEGGAELLDHALPRSVRVLRRLRRLGVSVALDDFGTGQSSLAKLVSFPVDFLKVDRSFVIPMLDDILRAEVVRATIELAHTARLRVVAEGVETAEHARRLRELGADFAQGFHFGRPMSAPRLLAWLQDGPSPLTGGVRSIRLRRPAVGSPHGLLPHAPRQSL